MYRTFFIISDYDIQGVVLSENNEIISINHVSYLINKEYEILNAEIMQKYIEELIVKLEQYCNISIHNVYVFLHGFIPWNISIKLVKEGEQITAPNTIYKIDHYHNYFINNKYYPFILDTKHEILYNNINIYTNTIYIECIKNIFNNCGLNIENIMFAPLQLIKTCHYNTIVALLYNHKLVLAVNRNNEINIYTYENINNIALYSNLNYNFGNVDQIIQTRKFINKISEYIKLITKKEKYNIYFTGKFCFFPDLIPYLKHYSFHDEDVNEIGFLQTNHALNVNLVYYGSLLQLIKNIL